MRKKIKITTIAFLILLFLITNICCFNRSGKIYYVVDSVTGATMVEDESNIKNRDNDDVTMVEEEEEEELDFDIDSNDK